MKETNEIKAANSLLGENVINEEENENLVKIFYSDFDLEKRTDILKAIDAANERIDVFGDELVRDAIEDELKNKPLFVVSGQEIINKMNFDV